MWSWIFSTRGNSQITTPATTTPPATALIPAINPPTEARSSTMTHPFTYTNSTTVFPLTATTAAASPSTSLPLSLTEDVPAITTPGSTPSPLSQLRNGVTTAIEQGTIVDNHNPRRMHFRIHNRRRDRNVAPGNFPPGSFPLPTEAQFQRLFDTLRTNIRLGIMSQFVELVYDDIVAAPVVGTVPITQAASTTRASSEVPILQTPPSTITDARVAVSAVGSAPAAAFAIPSPPNVQQIISTTPAVNANINATPAHKDLSDAVQKTQKVGNVAKTLPGPSVPTPAVRRRNAVETVVNTPPSPNVLQNPARGARATDVNALLRMEIGNITHPEPATRIPRHQGPAPLNDFVVTHTPATQGESSTASFSGIRHRQRRVDTALELESEQSVQWEVSAGSSSSQQHRRGFQTVLGLKPAIRKFPSADSSALRKGLQKPRVAFAEPVVQGGSSTTSPSLQNQPRRPRVAFVEPVVNGESSADSPSLQSCRHRAALEVEPARGAPASGPQNMLNPFLDPPPSYSTQDPNATYFAGIPPPIARVSQALENFSRPDPPRPVRRSTRNKQPSGAASGSRASRPRDTPWTRVPFEPHDHTLHPPYNQRPRRQPTPQQPTANGRAHGDGNIPSHSNYGFWQASQAAIPSSNQVAGTRKRTVEAALGEVDVNGSAKRSRRS